jgi:hypothetical protein
VKHAIYHRSNNLGVDESVMWGDHYLLEALDLSERSGTSRSRNGAAS